MKIIEPLYIPKEMDIQRHANGIDVYIKRKSLVWLWSIIVSLVVFLWVSSNLIGLMGGFGVWVSIALVAGSLYFLFAHQKGRELKDRLFSNANWKKTGKKIEFRADGIQIESNFFRMNSVIGFIENADEFSTSPRRALNTKVHGQIAVRYGIYSYATPFVFSSGDALKIIIALNDVLSEMRGTSPRAELLQHQSTKF
jgi:hypothetical protein